MKSHLLSSLFLFTTIAPLQAGIEHGTLNVTTGFSGGSGLSFNADTSQNVTISTRGVTNKGDYALEFGPDITDDDTELGILISSIAENGRSGDYATAQIEKSGTDAATNYYFLPVFQAGVSEAEINMNVSFGYFPFTEFWGGRLENSVNNGVYDSLTGALGPSGSSLDTDPTDGISTLVFGVGNAPGSALPGSSQNGILLVSGAKNEANYALSRANSDGTFTIYCHDNNANQDTYENDPYAFVYIPFDHSSEQLIAMGRIAGIPQGESIDSGAENTAGDFTLTKGSTGLWYLEIAGYSAGNATLLVSPEGGGVYNIDNIVSSEWDSGGQRWEIQTRDLVSTNLQDVNLEEPTFSFVVMARGPITLYVDESSSGINSGRSWEAAFTDLQSAIDHANDDDQIWIAEGVYKPSMKINEADPRSATFLLEGSNIRLYGGFPQGGDVFENRSTEDFPAILSGDIGVTNDHSDNSYNVIRNGFGSQIMYDGLWITAGNADGFTSSYPHQGRGGGIFLVQSSTIIHDCFFVGNRASQGGALDLYFGTTNTITRCRFFGNHAISQGGVSYAESNTSTLFSNCSFVENTAEDLASIAFVDGTTITQPSYIYFGNCTLFQNASTTADVFALAEIGSVEVRNSITFESSNAYGFNGTSYPYSMRSGDPLFRQLPSSGAGGWSHLADNDYGDLRLAYNSPAIDQGSGSAGEVDLSGKPRKRDGNNDDTLQIDQGAYEFQPQIVTNLDNQGPGSLRQAIADAEDNEAVYFSSTLPENSEIELSSAVTVSRSIFVNGAIGAGSVTLVGEGSSVLYIHDDRADSSYTPVRLFKLQITNPVGKGIINKETLRISQCVFFQNSGHAIHNVGNIFIPFALKDESNASLEVRDSRFIGNRSMNSDGGAILSEWAWPITIERCQFLANYSNRDGGALYLSTEGGRAPVISNCSFVGNTADHGGAIWTASDITALIANCSFAENAATETGGAIYADSGNVNLNNSILWGNTAGTTDPQIRGTNIGTLNLIEGVSGAQHPQFVKTPDPGADALWSIPDDPGWSLPDMNLDDNNYGDLRLLSNSPAIDAGDGDSSTSLNTSATDLSGSPRFVGTIDLGAYEGSFASFSGLYPGLDPAEDDNSNGSSNFLDYAAGGDPTAFNNPTLRASISENGFSFSIRNNATDFVAGCEKSTTLLADSWEDMVLGIDYTIHSETENGVQTTFTIQLLSNDPLQFIRAVYTPSP